MTFYTRQCDHCGRTYHGQGVKYCSGMCRDDARRPEQPYKLCEYCGQEFAVPYMSATQGYRYVQKFCSVECSKEAQRTWYIDKHGYRCTTRNGKQCYEHREVMENYIGRKLFPTETVHHKNGNRKDNRLENLELWSTRNPKGQRIADKLQYVAELAREYGFIGMSHCDFASAALYGGF